MKLFLIPLAIGAVALAGCGSGTNYGSGGSSSNSSTGSASSGAQAVKTHQGKLGTFLVDSQGRTLYLFEKDKGPKSTCSGACAQAWPPATTSGSPSGAGGIQSKLLGTTMRSDGGRQLTYHGHPLYRYAGDNSPGQTAGQGLDQFGAEWYVVGTSGSKIEKAATASAKSTPKPSYSSGY